MRSTILRTAMTVTVSFVVAACSSGGGVHVSSTTAPDANLTGRRTFRVLDAPERRAEAPALLDGDPMLNNSITNRQLRADIVQGLERKGYVVDPANPDFLVAYYAGTREKLDTTYWAADPYWTYGYPGYGFRRGRFLSAWPWYGYDSPYPTMRIREYTEGAVIIDVIDPESMELLWRGQGVAKVSNDPEKYTRDLDESVQAILDRFPQAAAAVAAPSPP